jgi:hypothetical protein
MISLNIPEVKQFMAKLLTMNTFDDFLLREMELQTFTNFKITGQLNEEFYTKEELEEKTETDFVQWGDVRNTVFSMIKGNKTPLSLKIVFQLSSNSLEELVLRAGGKIQRNEVGGLYLNIRFDKGNLHIITGVAIKTFTLDKTLEQEWDAEVKNILRANGVIFEEV